MTKTRTYMMFLLAILAVGATAQTANLHERAMCGAINGVKMTLWTAINSIVPVTHMKELYGQYI
jgi:hypothetical protein